jgi:hypothetical protein
VDPTRELTVEGRDLSVGVVRGRPLGFEFGINYVRKSINKNFVLPSENFASFGLPGTPVSTVTYTATENLEVTGVDSHVLIPAGRIGRRVQIGVLLGGGLGAVPTTTVRKTAEGPPFYAVCDQFSVGGPPLANPPATGGCVPDEYGQSVPLVPGTRYGQVDQRFQDILPMSSVWLFMRTQIAADVQIAQPLKVRFAGGFNFPSAQYFGVDLVYLFMTGQ